MKKVTIQDIADELNISRNTVSKAINNAEGIAEATRLKILQKAAEMGYKQFSYLKISSDSNEAQQKREGGEVALLFGDVIAPTHFASLMLDKLKMELSQIGYTLNMHRVEQDNYLHHSLPVTFSAAHTSAIICIEMFNRAYDEMICSLGLPVLFVDGPNKRDGHDLPADQLYMDNTTAITRFVNDMLAKGKHRIGFIGDYEHCQSFFERYTAFRCAMLMAGAPVEERFCIKANQSEQITAALTGLPDFPEVFICANDFVADDAIYTLRKLGKSIPKDILFCGFDDSPNSRIMTPSLTTVHIHTQSMAIAAMHLLLSRLDNPNLNYRIMHTETELIYRDSTQL